MGPYPKFDANSWGANHLKEVFMGTTMPNASEGYTLGSGIATSSILLYLVLELENLLLDLSLPSFCVF